jgi:hypothetical protein
MGKSYGSAWVGVGLAVGLALLGLQGCQSRQFRKLASEAGEVTVSKDLWSDSGEFLYFVSGPSFTPDNCVSILTQVQDKLFNASSTYFDREITEQYLADIIQNVFKSRVALHDRLHEFSVAGALTPECVNAARGLNRAARFLEDYLGELQAKPAAADPKHPATAWTGPWPSVLVNPNISKDKGGFDLRKTLRSGDLLMSRGAAFTSAAIARLGDAASQFSHLSLVYIDEATQDISVIQAEIEIGVVVTPLDKYLAGGNVRVALYRYPDATIAARAAKLMFDKVSAATRSGHKVPYNFSLDLSDRDELFCSQVIYQAYQLASDGAVKIPLYKSRLDHMRTSFTSSIGVTATETYLPGDTEVDPRLEFIAEWRDLSRMKTTRERDVLLDEVYSWINTRGYALRPNLKSWTMEEMIYRARRWPLFGSLLDKRFPLNMSKSTLGTISELNDTVAILEGHLERAQSDFKNQTGLWMGERDMIDSLEDYRNADSMRIPSCYESLHGLPAQSLEPVEFHQRFRPGC